MHSMPYAPAAPKGGTAVDLELLARFHAMQDAVDSGFLTPNEALAFSRLIDVIEDIEEEDEAKDWDDAEAEAWIRAGVTS